MNGFGLCRRCGTWAVELLRTHSFCWECNYSPENDASLTPWIANEYSHARLAARRRLEENRAYFEECPDYQQNESEAN